LRLCIIIPSYNHGAQLHRTIDSISQYRLPIIVVDDGSSDEDKIHVVAATNRYGAELISLPKNLGKGGAVMEGFRAADRLGFTHAIQMDADGQHDPNAVSDLIKAATACPDALIVGHPIFDESAPGSRLFGRRIANFFVGLETLSTRMPDSMCGFRVYPLATCLDLMKTVRLTHRMDFDIEIIVRFAWLGVPLIPVAARVTYPDDGVSNYRVWRDNWLIVKLHTRLVFGMMWRLPKMIAGKTGG
jgi:glycosyltransferase involved in cell wall biosynthesis